MRFGVCGPVRMADTAAVAGYDYIECPASELQPEATDEYFRNEVLRVFQASPLPVEAFCGLLPRDLAIVGPQVDQMRVLHYLNRVLGRIHDVGAHLVVFGSGAARTVPAGFASERAKEQILDFLRCLRDRATPLGLTAVVEPLNHTETNMLLSLSEAMDYVTKVGEPVALLADFYHMQQEGEPLEHLVEAGPALRHVHVADRGRRAPGTGDYPYRAFAEALAGAQYTGRISIECRWQAFAHEAAPALRFLRGVMPS